MRFVVVGAGAIGGLVGSRLTQAGHDVVLVARGRHGRLIADHGLAVIDPDGEAVVRMPVVDDLARLSFGSDDIVLLAVKSQHTARATDEILRTGDSGIPVVCLQNGVANERTALRTFARVYGCAVMCPAVFLEPGVVHAHASPVTGLLDIGRYPRGVDDLAERVAATFRSATFRSEARHGIAAVKYGKLLTNLGNAIEVVCGPTERKGPLGDLLRAEGERVLGVAGIAFETEADDPRRELISPRPIAGRERVGGSTLQSILRGAGTIETDFLNGEIVLLGRLYGVPTPANAMVTALAHDVVNGRRAAASVPVAEMLAFGGV